MEEINIKTLLPVGEKLKPVYPDFDDSTGGFYEVAVSRY